MSDEGFHEIQLNGKQLVFLFMAATVVSVVIFLSGVMVGRGVRDRTTSAPAADGYGCATSAGDGGGRTPGCARQHPSSCGVIGIRCHHQHDSGAICRSIAACRPDAPDSG